MRKNKFFKILSGVTIALGIGLLLSGCSQTNKTKTVAENQYVNPNGSFVVNGNGAVKTKSVDKKRATLDVYFDPLCPSCGEFERASSDYLNQETKSGKLLIRYHPLMFLDQGSTDSYSSRASAYTLGVAEYAPKLAGKFVENLYAKNFQPQEGPGYKPVSTEKISNMFLSIGGTKAQDKVIKANMKKFGMLSYKTTLRVMKDKELVKKSPTGELFTPFVIPNAPGKTDGKALMFNKDMLSSLKSAVSQITK